MRIARLRNDWEGQWWLHLEMVTVRKAEGEDGDELSLRRSRALSAEVAAHMSEEEWRVIGDRVGTRWVSMRRPGPKTFQGLGLPDAEEHVAGLEAQIDALVLPDGLSSMAMFARHKEFTEAKIKLRAAVTEARQMLARIRNQIGDYLSETERQILFGQVNADVFERNRRYVDERLLQLAPQALEQFASAYRRQSEGDAEARSHALTSCRRVLKTLADVLYPASNAMVEGVDGVERKMTDDKFVMRLCQFAGDKIGMSGPSRDLLLSQIKMLGDRLDALNALGSKGVHDEVTAAEVDQCLIQTYLTAGDLLRLADDRSAALVATAP
jgi:hypothetical protein